MRRPAEGTQYSCVYCKQHRGPSVFPQIMPTTYTFQEYSPLRAIAKLYLHRINESTQSYRRSTQYTRNFRKYQINPKTVLIDANHDGLLCRKILFETEYVSLGRTKDGFNVSSRNQ